MIQYGLRESNKLGHRSVIVSGHENYYSKFGFLPASKWKIKSPFEVPENAFMAIELIPNALKGVQGIVKYPIEFNEV